MSKMTLGLVGATGCIGKEIVDLLEPDERVDTLVPIASKGTKEPQISFRSQSVSLRELESSALSSVDAVIAAGPASIGKDGLQFIVDEGIPLIDLSGVWGSSVPVMAAGFEADQGNRLREAGVVSAARPESLILARILRCVQEVSPVLRVGGTMMMPAAVAGRDGVEELSRQVVSMFNSQEPPRNLFPRGLAFDVLPSWGGIGESGWAGYELLCALQTGLLTRMNPQLIGVDVAVLPLFGGMAAALRFDFGPGWEIDAIRAAVKDSEDLEWTPPEKLMPRRFIGSSSLAVGRLRSDLSQTSLHLWVCCDPQRLAAENAVGLMEQLLWSEA